MVYQVTCSCGATHELKKLEQPIKVGPRSAEYISEEKVCNCKRKVVMMSRVYAGKRYEEPSVITSEK